IYPKGTKSVYKVTTTEGTSTECCEDHLWYTETAEDRRNKISGSVKLTKEIINTLGKNHYLPRNEPIYFNKNKLPLPAYTLGAIIGDGSINTKIVLHNIDESLINKVNSEISQLEYTLHKNGKMSY